MLARRAVCVGRFLSIAFGTRSIFERVCVCVLCQSALFGSMLCVCGGGIFFRSSEGVGWED